MMSKRITINNEDVLLSIKGGNNLYFKSAHPTPDANGEISLQHLLSYVENIKCETEVKLSSIDRTLDRIISQIEKIKEGIS